MQLTGNSACHYFDGFVLDFKDFMLFIEFPQKIYTA
jgi:hypothetical protein